MFFCIACGSWRWTSHALWQTAKITCSETCVFINEEQPKSWGVLCSASDQLDVEGQGIPKFMALLFWDQSVSYMTVLQKVLQSVSIYLLTYFFSFHIIGTELWNAASLSSSACAQHIWQIGAVWAGSLSLHLRRCVKNDRLALLSPRLSSSPSFSYLSLDLFCHSFKMVPALLCYFTTAHQ